MNAKVTDSSVGIVGPNNHASRVAILIDGYGANGRSSEAIL